VQVLVRHKVGDDEDDDDHDDDGGDDDDRVVSCGEVRSTIAMLASVTSEMHLSEKQTSLAPNKPHTIPPTPVPHPRSSTVSIGIAEGRPTLAPFEPCRYTSTSVSSKAQSHTTLGIPTAYI